MSPTLTSQGLVLATAMAATAVLFDLLREKYFPPTSQKPLLKSCLSASGRTMKKQKKVKFAEEVKDTKGNGQVYRKESRKGNEIQKSCGNEKMPSNHAALYTGILKDRVHTIQYSY